MGFAKCFHFMQVFILLLFQIQNRRVYAVPPTYDSCMNNTASSYKVGGWCFLFYHDSSWPTNIPTQDGAQTACLPYGTLAVGVTYKMLQYFTTISPTVQVGWLGLARNTSYTVQAQGWYWNILLPSGSYASFPAIMSNIPWGSGEPNNYRGSENFAITAYNWGVGDTLGNYSASAYYVNYVAVICQFAPRQWKYSPRGHGRFNVTSGYQIAQSTVIKLDCLRQCHTHPGCISMTYNPTTQDCQIYSVSPEDPRFVSKAVADSAYNWYIRDGMVY